MSAIRRFALRSALAVAALSSLGACSTVGKVFSDEENVGPCPNAFALYEASRLVTFGGDGSEAYDNVSYTAEIQNVTTLCRYYGDNPIDADIELEIGFGRGPAAESRRHAYRYWVAVTRRDIAVIEKRDLEINVSFPRGEDRVYQRERIKNISIPRAGEDTSGANFEIIVGFDLTPEQLAFNRDGKRFTVDAAARAEGETE